MSSAAEKLRSLPEGGVARNFPHLANIPTYNKGLPRESKATLLYFSYKKPLTTVPQWLHLPSSDFSFHQ